MTTTKHTMTTKPCAMMGAGQLVTALWKTDDERRGSNVRFNVYRMSCRTGCVSQFLRPSDVPDLVKLCQVLAVTLADDLCVPSEDRRTLAELAIKLDTITKSRF